MGGKYEDMSASGQTAAAEGERSLAEWTRIWREVAPDILALHAMGPATQVAATAETRSVSTLWRSPETHRLLEILAFMPPDFTDQRISLVAAIRQNICEHDVTVEHAALDRVMQAMELVPRELFVHPDVSELAYLPTSMDIGCDQTISNPHIVAAMTLAADLPDDANVLDVGTGSGYQAAILSLLAASVTTIEILPAMADRARDRLHTCGYGNIEVRSGDGFSGAPDRAPFDAIIVAAAAAYAPGPLLEQLAPRGRLIMPIGPSAESDRLTVMTKMPAGGFETRSLGPVKFVPLTGAGQR